MSNPINLRLSWCRLIFAILRREQNSLMDQSLAFCLFLSGVFSFSFFHQGHILRVVNAEYILKDLPFPHPPSPMLGSLHFRQVNHAYKHKLLFIIIIDSFASPFRVDIFCEIFLCESIESVLNKQQSFKDFSSDPELRHAPCGILICARSLIYIWKIPFREGWL